MGARRAGSQLRLCAASLGDSCQSWPSPFGGPVGLPRILVPQPRTYQVGHGRFLPGCRPCPFSLHILCRRCLRVFVGLGRCQLFGVAPAVLRSRHVPSGIASSRGCGRNRRLARKLFPARPLLFAAPLPFECPLALAYWSVGSGIRLSAVRRRSRARAGGCWRSWLARVAWLRPPMRSPPAVSRARPPRETAVRNQFSTSAPPRSKNRVSKIFNSYLILILSTNI